MASQPPSLDARMRRVEERDWPRLRELRPAALIDEVEAWARSTVDAGSAVKALRLEVHEDNARAQAAYRRLGFTETGATAPYPLDPTRRELEMVRGMRSGVE